MVILGIDPDKGWAVVCHNPKPAWIVKSGTVKNIQELYNVIENEDAQMKVEWYREFLVRIERPTNRKTFPRPGLSVAANMKISHNCGMNYQKATDLGDYCSKIGIRYEYVSPARRKLNAKEVKTITGYKGKTSSHSRDAIMIAWR